MPILNIQQIDHKGQNRIALFYDYIANNQLDKITRGLPNRRYSRTKKCWHIPYRDDYKDYLNQYYANIEDIGVIIGNTPTTEKVPKEKKGQQERNKTVLLRIDKTKGKIYIEHPYSPHLHGIILVTKKGFWLKKQHCWVFKSKNDIYATLFQLIKKSGYDVRKIIIDDDHHGKPKKAEPKAKITKPALNDAAKFPIDTLYVQERSFSCPIFSPAMNCRP